MSAIPRGILLSGAAPSQPGQVIENVRLDRARLLPETFWFATVRDCGFKTTTFDRITFHFVTFIRCYFRSARFDTARFEGCRFVDCNFREAVFDNCSFDYSEFSNTHLAYKQVKDSLPRDRYNVLMFLARNLKVNAMSVGDTDDARAFLLVELSASKAFNFRKAFMWTHPFYKKYSFTEKLGGLGQVVWLEFSELIWGHGERPLRIGGVAALLVGIFAWIFSLPGLGIAYQRASPGAADYLEFSLGSFTNASISHWQSSGTGTAWLAHLEGIIGLILFGFLVAAVFRRFSRR